MMSKRFYRSIAAVFVLIAVGLTGCGVPGQGEKQADTCFIYTDGLLDDLCAIEYLGGRYDKAVVLLQDPDGLADSPYGSRAVTDESALFNVISNWFDSVAPYSDSTDISKADLYLLAPLTAFSALLKADPSLRSRRALLMAGDSEGPDGAGGDWNAIMDPEAYRYVTENMTDLIQMTRPVCESEYETNAYPFDAQFLAEYTAQMASMDENLCCYDLQAVALYFK